MPMYKTNKAVKIMTMGNQQIEVHEPPTIFGPTDGIQFAGHMAGVVGGAKFGDMCPCGKDKLINVIAEDEADAKGRKRIVLKCYACKQTFASEYPKKDGDNL